MKSEQNITPSLVIAFKKVNMQIKKVTFCKRSPKLKEFQQRIMFTVSAPVSTASIHW